MVEIEYQGAAHKHNAVHIFVLLDELVDIPMFHPLGDHRKLAATHRYSC
jgi:hypothetical protein